MKKLLPALLISFVASTAFAQTGGVPPEQAPAGNPGKLTKPSKMAAPAAATAPADATAAPKTAAEKRAARKAKRAAKVGDKPLN